MSTGIAIRVFVNIVLKAAWSLILLFSVACNAQDDRFKSLTVSELTDLIEKNSPLNGATIPADMADRLGAAHVAGKYALTESPFLIEGSDAIQRLGMGTIKLWFQHNPANDYPYHSDWNLAPGASLVDIAMHPYFKTVFDMPFRTFALSVRGETDLQRAIEEPVTDYVNEENAIYLLAKYLLQTYRDREVVFILHNWEGDWLMRGGTGADAHWTAETIPADVRKRSQVMTDWFKARQAGVDKARKEIGETACKVYHAIEVNKVLDVGKDVPCLTSHVLPYVKTDMVSWSCYEGLADPVDLWRGMAYINEHMKPTGEFPAVPIMIGEIGIPENEGTVFGIAAGNDGIIKEELIKRWDRAMSVFIMHDIPYIIHWEVYCNEVKSGVKKASEYTHDQLRGFWLIRPDGTLSHSASYLKKLVQHGGRKIED